MRKSVKKLQLTRETLVLLGEQDARRIAGGTTTDCWESNEFMPVPSLCDPRNC